MNHYFVRWPGFLKKAVTLSYDDGVTQDVRLISIMDQYGIKGTFNLNGHEFTENRPAIFSHERLSRSVALELYNTPEHEVAIHSYTHPFLEQLPAGNAAWQIVQDRQALEQMYGTIVRGMAYPMGTYNDDVVNTLRQCGVAYARTVKSTYAFTLPEDWLRWHPTCHHRDSRLQELCDKFLDLQIKWGAPRLFYLWGHSYEFDDKDNWHVIENFCKQMGGRADIWYATNMEIYTYIEASRQIVASMDGSRIYNPTVTTLYLEADGKDIVLEPGQTIQL